MLSYILHILHIVRLGCMDGLGCSLLRSRFQLLLRTDEVIQKITTTRGRVTTPPTTYDKALFIVGQQSPVSAGTIQKRTRKASTMRHWTLNMCDVSRSGVTLFRVLMTPVSALGDCSTRINKYDGNIPAFVMENESSTPPPLRAGRMLPHLHFVV